MICLEDINCDDGRFWLDFQLNIESWAAQSQHSYPSPCYRRSLESRARRQRHRRSFEELAMAILNFRGTRFSTPSPALTNPEIATLLMPENYEQLKLVFLEAIGRQFSSALASMISDNLELSSVRNIMSYCHFLGGREYVYLILQALQFEERCQVRRLQKECFDMVCQIIGLDTIIEHHDLSRRSREYIALNRKQQEFRRLRSLLRQSIETLVDPRRGMAFKFEFAHADIINGFVDRLNSCRRDWERMKHNALQAQPPTPEQVRDYRRLEALEQECNQIETLIHRRDELNDDLWSLQRRRRRVSSEERTEINNAIQRQHEEINNLRIRIARLNEERRSNRAERQRLRTILNRGGQRQRIQHYLELESSERVRFNASQRGLRDELINDFNNLIRRDTDHPLVSLVETDKWNIYRALLERLIEGVGNASIEHIFTEVFLGYGPVNSIRDVGLRNISGNAPPPTLSIGTYHGHGYPGYAGHAVDINTGQALPFVAVAPNVFILPERFREGRQAEPYEYTGTRSVQSRTRSTNDLHDVFAKIAYGLLRPSSGGRTSRSDIEELLSEPQVRQRLREERTAAHDADDIMTQEMLESTNDLTVPGEVGINPDARGILAGLTYHNLTERHVAGVSQRGIELLENERQEILDALENAVRRRLGLSEDVAIFREGGLRADQRGAGLRNLIVLRDRFRDVIQEVRNEIQENRSPNSITARLWMLLVELRGAGAPPSRAGQSVTVEHIFQSRRDADQFLCVRVFVAHPFEVGNVTTRCQQMGRVGTTGGSSVSVHNHVEIEVLPFDHDRNTARTDNRIGWLLPHEFFPIY